jgi:hypothetical protein
MQCRRNCLWLLPTFLSVLLAGCGDSTGGRQAISGTVTLKGQPLNDGTITFIPASAGATQAGATISKGAFQIAKAQGLQPGKYKVSINSPDGETPVDPNVPPGPSGNFSSKDRVPAEYNLESKLEVEVKKGEPNKFDFAIP